MLSFILSLYTLFHVCKSGGCKLWFLPPIRPQEWRLSGPSEWIASAKASRAAAGRRFTPVFMGSKSNSRRAEWLEAQCISSLLVWLWAGSKGWGGGWKLLRLDCAAGGEWGTRQDGGVVWGGKTGQRERYKWDDRGWGGRWGWSGEQNIGEEIQSQTRALLVPAHFILLSFFPSFPRALPVTVCCPDEALGH